MADQAVNYQCPSCHGPLHFDSETGKLACDYCGSSFAVAEIEALYAQKEAKATTAYQEQTQKEEAQRAAGTAGAAAGAAEDAAWAYGGQADWGADGAEMRAYTCPSCGAELICEATTAATSCPYCGNPTVVPGQFAGTFRPDVVLPFRVDKEAAIRVLKRHYEGKPLLPKAFAAENHIHEIQGIYVPFWLFDGTVDVDVEMNATRMNDYSTLDEEIIETEHYRLHRAGTVDFERIPVDGSRKMPDDYMDSIEPFDYAELKPFSTAYLPGYLAEKYDVDVAECAGRADERARNTAREAVSLSAAEYDTVTIAQEEMRLHRGKVQYALLPVWMLSTRYAGKNYLFAMNGQTGEMVGNLPVDKGLAVKSFFKTFLTSTAITSAILFVVLRLLI